jgi:two-component system chemotaxis sensor kinase CheA
MIDLSLLEDFIGGAGESLDEMETALLELEISPTNNELLNTIFRAMHTIKGAAQFVGLDKVSALSHVLEDLLDLLREGKKTVTPDIISLLIQTKDRISLLVIDLEKTKSEITNVDDLIEQIKIHLIDDTDQQEPVDFEESEEMDLSTFLAEDSATEDDDFLNAQEDEPEFNLDAFLAEDTAETAVDKRTEFANPDVETNVEEQIILPDEEHDQELFGIFIQQLREKATVLNDIVDNLGWAANKTELLVTAIDTLESLKFSANYMGYESLTQFYSRWLAELLDARASLTTSNDVSFDFMITYLTKLGQIFPQLSDVFNPKTPFEKDLTQATDSAINSLNMDEQASLAFVEDFLSPDHQSLDIHSRDTVSFDDGTAKSVLDDEDYLFAKLSHALDSSIERSITAEPINEVFSVLLNAANEQKTRIAAEEKEKNQLKIKTLAEANLEPEPQITVQPVQNQIATPDKTTSKLDNIEQPSVTATTTTDKALKKSIRVDADKIDSLMNQVGELIVDRAYFFQLANEINELQRYLKEVTGLAQKDLKPVRTFAYRFSEAIISLGRTSNELQEGVMKVRMLPISQLFNRYPRLVHDLAHTNGKKVQLEIRGEETELDKMIIEEISDPLIHMIRNAIGHGIETSEVRKQLGKPETGTLILEAYHESNHIVIEVTDDGRGIDTDRIKAKAEEMNLFSSEELNRMSLDDLTRFVMLPGFSTAKEINSTSGRGVGMDVVKKNIEKLNGTIEVESRLGVETKIRLKIPLTLAIIQALLVRVGEDSYTIPLANVEETLRVTPHEISLLEDTEVMYLRGKTLPIFRLSVLFDLKSAQKAEQTNFFVVVVNTGNQKVGLMVDSLLGQEEVVIKPLVDYLHEQNCFSGATIIGDGRISLILDVYELINMTTDKQVKKHEEQERRSIASLEGRD